MNEFSPADEKALALVYAYTALVRALELNGTLDMDILFTQLAGARVAARASGEHGAAALLETLAESLQRI